MLRLKADLHIHTADDPFDRFVNYSAYDLIDRAALAHFDVLAITCHDLDVSTPEVIHYAADKNILLIPGLELNIPIDGGGRHVLIYNAGESGHWPRNFDDVRELRDAGAYTIAPHPFFPAESAVGPYIADHRDCFDAIEHTSFYFPWVNYNRRAVRAAKEWKMPLMGSSDMHYAWQFEKTYSFIEAEEKSIDGVFDAIRAGRIDIVTEPLSLNRYTLRMGLEGARVPHAITERFAPTLNIWA